MQMPSLEAAVIKRTKEVTEEEWTRIRKDFQLLVKNERLTAAEGILLTT